MTKSNGKSLPVKSAQSTSAPSVAEIEQFLATCANTIRSRRKQIADDFIDIGTWLVKAKEVLGHGNWLPWLKQEFGWTDKTAETYINIAKAATSGKFEVISNLDLSVTVLGLLAAPSTPPEAVDAVADRAKAGETMTGAEVKRVVYEAKSKSPPRPPDSGTKKRGGEETKRHDERMKSARNKLEAFVRDYSDMAEWKALIETIKTQLGAKHV